MPDFLDLHAVGADALRRILDDAHAVKARLRETWDEAPLRHRTLAMVFDKPSTRTRVSFDVGMRQLGGETIVLDATGTQMGRGETIADTARVLSRYVDAIMIRTTGHDRLGELAEHATVPVINGLTDETHPCQIMADVMCYEEHRETIRGRTVAWTGDGNNVCATLVEAAPLFGFRLRCATPEGFEPAERFVRAAEGHVELTNDPRAAVEGADLVVTDTWHSMGSGGGAGGDAGHNTFAPYRVDKSLMALAAPDALFMHCLPAHRGEEVTDEVMDGPQSVVFDEAENRLHAQKAVLRWALGATG